MTTERLSSEVEARLERELARLREACRARARFSAVRRGALAGLALATLGAGAWWVMPRAGGELGEPARLGARGAGADAEQATGKAGVGVVELDDDELGALLAEAGRPGLVRVGSRVYLASDLVSEWRP